MKNPPDAKPPEPGQPDPRDLSIKFTIIFGLFAIIPLVLMYHFLSGQKSPDDSAKPASDSPTATICRPTPPGPELAFLCD